MDISTQEFHRRERFRRIGFSVAASLVARGFSLVTTLITIPLALNYLGDQRYAIWVTLSSIAALLAFADLGIGNGLINALSVANGKDDPEAARKYVSSAFFMLLAIVLAIGVIFTLVFPLVSWDRIYNVTSAQAIADAAPATALFVICFLINIPLGIVQKVFMGYQEVYIDNLWFVAGKLLSLVAIVAAIKLNASFLWLVFALVGVPLIVTFVESISLFYFRHPFLRPTLHGINPMMLGILLRLGWLFFVLQVSGTLAYSIDNLVIAQVISADAVTAYSIPSQLFKLITVAVSLLSLPLWPAYGEAIARHDLNWVKTNFKRSLAINFASSALVSVILVAFGQQIMHAWVGHDVAYDPTLLIALAVWTTMYNVSSALAMLFNAANVIRFQVIWASLMAVLNLGLSVVLTHQFGMIGVVLGSIFSYMICIFPPYFMQIPKLFATLETQGHALEYVHADH